MKRFYLLALLLVSLRAAATTCNAGFDEYIVRIVPDNYPNETSWNIANENGSLIASGTTVGDTVCVPTGSCIIINVLDSYGDGIFSPGGYWIYKNRTLINSGGPGMGHGVNIPLGCTSGSYCSTPDTLTTGSHTTSHDNHWYTFTASQTGMYKISTCSTNTCNTTIWVYTSCPNLPYVDGPPGTYAFNDNFCGTQAELSVVMVANSTYIIRIGDELDDCTDPINFTFAYDGAVRGCTDPASCNFNPLATIDDSSCVYFPNPLCQGPDLKFDSAAFVQSLALQTQNAQNCDVVEGCLLDYGTRYVIRFTSKVLNVGTLDYYIGTPASQPGMFNTQNCHGHAHYEGYGDYRLIDVNGNVIPAGHKNGFCVMDLCGGGQYNCGNMGISAGCYDVYGAGTQCQWIDITDVPAGDYRLAVIINSQHLPDALGRHEINYLNNATQVCIRITRNASNVPSYTLLPNCSPFVDCDGVPGGSSVMDCNNVCNGPAVFGDTYNDSQLNTQDVTTYMDMIVAAMGSTRCYDLNGDSSLSVYDAALANWCIRSSPGTGHSHCNFPRNVNNGSTPMGLGVEVLNTTDNYVDIGIKNPSAKVTAYQFTLSGVNISSVVSIADPATAPADVRLINGTNEIVAIFDSTLERSPGATAQNLVRVYFSSMTDTAVCIASIREIVNENGEKVVTYIYQNCRSTSTTSIATNMRSAELAVIPNPAKERAFVHVSAEITPDQITVTDMNGKVFNPSWNTYRQGWYEVDLRTLSNGVYFIRVQGDGVIGTTRMIKIEN